MIDKSYLRSQACFAGSCPCRPCSTLLVWDAGKDHIPSWHSRQIPPPQLPPRSLLLCVALLLTFQIGFLACHSSAGSSSNDKDFGGLDTQQGIWNSRIRGMFNACRSFDEARLGSACICSSLHCCLLLILAAPRGKYLCLDLPSLA